jgi:hypothetical protein
MEVLCLRVAVGSTSFMLFSDDGVDERCNGGRSSRPVPRLKSSVKEFGSRLFVKVLEKPMEFPASSSLSRVEIGNPTVTVPKRQVACGETKLAYKGQKIPHF